MIGYGGLDPLPPVGAQPINIEWGIVGTMASCSRLSNGV